MTEETKQDDRFKDLRRQAEALIQQWPDIEPQAQNDMLMWLNELRIHQVELEIQNEELKQAQQKITALHHEFENLYELAPCGYITLNPKGLITRCNRTGMTLLGEPHTRLNGRGITAFIAKQSCNDLWQALRQSEKSKEKKSVELALNHRKDEQRWVRADIHTQCCSSGELFQWRLTLVDITRRIQLQKQLLQAQKMESIGVLAGGIAHEFNNILSIIIGNTELAMEDLTHGTAVAGNIQEIQSAGLRAKEMVQQLLTFSHASDIRRKPLHFATIINDALKLIRASLPSAIELQEKIPVMPQWVMCNATQLQQVILNLCHNAIDAMQENGGTLSIQTNHLVLEHPLRSDLETIPSGSYVILTVADTGRGISAATLSRIFDPFFTTKAVGKGTGLGLAVVHGIIKQHHGHITVTSETESGTMFTIYLPIYTSATEKDVNIAAKLPSGRENILLVDDEKAILQLSQQHLIRLGYQVSACDDPVRALELFSSDPSKFDLVITDMAMPKMTGESLAEAILNIRPRMSVILCSGYSEIISTQNARKLGIARFLMKPMTKATLAHNVRKVLDQK